MATQTFHLFTIAGQAADWLRERFDLRLEPSAEMEVDRIGSALIDHRIDPSMIHAVSWIDKWSMLPLATEVDWHVGRRYHLASLRTDVAANFSKRIRLSNDEDRWFAKRKKTVERPYLGESISFVQ